MFGMRRLQMFSVGVCFVALWCVSTAPTSAQENRPFGDLGRYLHEGDVVDIVERTEGASTGVVSRVTPTELFVTVAGQERRLTEDTIGWIKATPDSVWDGAAIGGAIVFSTYGIFAWAYGYSGAAFLMTLGGAAAGAGLDALVSGKRVVYGKPAGLSFVRKPAPVTSLADLWSRVPPGASIVVRDATAGERKGAFVKASPEALTIEIGSGQRLVIPAAQVQLVRVRSHMSGTWIWMGLAIGGVGGFAQRHNPYNRHATREDTAVGIVSGGFLGVAVSRAARRYVDAYRPASVKESDVAVIPMVGQGRGGVALAVRF